MTAVAISTTMKSNFRIATCPLRHTLVTLVVLQSFISTFVVQGQIIDVIPGAAVPSAFPSASPTVFSVKVPPAMVSSNTPTVAPIPIAQATLPPWMLPTATSEPTTDATNSPTSVPVLSIVNNTTNMPTTGTNGPTEISPPSKAPGLSSPTADENVTETNRDSNNTIVKVAIPIIGVVAILLCCCLYVSHRPRRTNKKETRHDKVTSDRDYEFDIQAPDGGNSLFDDASLYTTSVVAAFSKNKNSSRKIADKTVESGSVDGVINPDFTDRTEMSYDDANENDEADDYVSEIAEESRTLGNSVSAFSNATPSSFDNRQIGYMEEGKMIQERYGQMNKELYSSEKISPRSDTSDIILQARSLLVSSQSGNESNAINSKNPPSPTSEEGVEIALLNNKSDHTAHYDDVVGVDTTSIVSYGTSNQSSSRISGERSVDKAMIVNSNKIIDLFAEDNYTSSEKLRDFDDPEAAAGAMRQTSQPQHHPLSTIALFTRGRKKGPFRKSSGNKAVSDIGNDMSQYKTDEPYPMTVPSIIDPMNSDDQNSSLIEPFSELTTDFQYGEQDSIGSNDAHVILESIKEGNHAISLSCDSSVNNAHVYENDNDSTNASLQFDNTPQRRGGGGGGDLDRYNLNLPLDFDGRDDGSTNSRFDNLYESMSNEWEWKQPSQTAAAPVVPNRTSDVASESENQLPSHSSIKSTGSSAEDVVRQLGNIFLV